jgi:membrane-bound lytic murein transglycosylase A
MPIRLFITIMLTCLALAGCKSNKGHAIDFDRELPPGQLALRKIPPSEYPDFSQCTWNLDVLARSVDQSIAYMSHGSSRQYYPYLDITHERAVASLAAFRAVLEQARRDPATTGSYINFQIRSNFEVYKSIGAPNPAGGYTDRVLFTGYHTPIYEASTLRTGAFQWPIYRRPSDLMANPETGEVAGRRLPDGQVVPYWTRGQIENENRLAGQELVYLKSRWEAYVVTVQGSAKLRMTDGRMLELGFAGHNGHEYVSPGRQLVADGVIARKDLNFRTLSSYFQSNPAAMDKYLTLNQRTVFFTERRGGPFGSLNVPVTAFASIATDKNERPNIYPRAMPAFLQVPLPRPDNAAETWAFSGFMMDQDSGGGIRASGRADIYMGVGPEAENVAGHQLYEGTLYYVAIKPELIGTYVK